MLSGREEGLAFAYVNRKGALRSVLAIALGSMTLMSGTAITVAQDAPAVFTSAQASRGAGLYRQNCLDCHGENLDDGEFGGAPLRGVAFKEKWFENSVGALVDFMRTTMPPDRPGRLSDQNYADLAAYILSRNGIQPGATELPTDPDALGNMIIR